MAKIIKVFAIILCCITTISFLEPMHTEAASKKANIILINSYNKGFTWTDDQVDGIVKHITEQYPNVNIFVEYLDWKNFPSDSVLACQYDLFSEKYRHTNIDLIITTDDAAMQFAIDYREDLFNGAPIIFGSVNKLVAIQLMKGVDNITGVYENIDTEGTAQLIQDVHPNVKTVYAITENTESGLSTLARINEGFQSLQNSSIQVVSLSDKSYEEIKDILSKPDEDSVVVMASYSTDANGLIFSPQTSSLEFGRISQMPIYLLHDNSMNDEVMGGSMLSGELHGEQIGSLAVQYLLGNAFDLIPIDKGIKASKIINYKALIKYDIAEDIIPKEYTIINKPFSLIETYSSLFLTILIAFIILASFIVILLLNIKLRKKTQNELYDKHIELENIYEIVSASEEELKSQNDVLFTQQEQLSAIEERYRLVSESANDIIWSWDLKTDKRELDNKIYEVLGFEKGELDTMEKWYTIIHVDDVDISKSNMEKYLNGEMDKYTCQYRVQKKNGEYIYILSTGIGAKDTKGQYIKMYGTHTDISQQILDQLQITSLAYNDYLTELPNRLSVKVFAENMMHTKNKKKSNKKMVLYFIDLDNFKFINNSFGHKTGDMLLKEVAKRLSLFKLENSCVGRIGGDEFVILAMQLPEEIEGFSKEVIELFKLPFIVNARSVYATASVGYAVSPEDGLTYDELLIKADLAMYQMKQNGKSQIARFTDSMNQEMAKKIEYQNLLHDAIENGELSIEYQPQYNFIEKHIEGFEALLRWNNPKLGFVPPNDFIPVAESGGLIISIGLFVLKEAFLFAKEINMNSKKRIIVCINISIIQLFQTDFVNQVLGVLNETGVDAKCIEFEVTETIYAENFEIFRNQLIQIKELGISISLDDFGTGYSSLTYLKRLPITTLKIDKKFTDDILGQKEEHILVETIIELGKKLDMRIIVEGVEEQEQLDFLEQQDCPLIQGFIYSKSLQRDAAKALFEKSQR